MNSTSTLQKINTSCSNFLIRIAIAPLRVNRVLTISLLSLCTVFCALKSGYAQQRSSDFIATDSSLATGFVSGLGNGKYEFKQYRNSTPVVFDANTIREFGEGGEVYESLEVGGEKVFYRRLASGPGALYQKKRSYILKLNDSLTHLTKENYRSVFEQKLVCEGGATLLTTVGYGRASMANFVNRVNRGKCTSGNLPYRRLGIYAGYNVMQLDVQFSDASSFKYKANAFVGGFFFDLPLYKPRSLFISGEVLVSKITPSFYSEKQNRTDFAGMDVTALMVPLGFKWVFPDSKIRPYTKAGAVVSYLKFNSNPEYFQTISNGPIIEIIQSEISATKIIQVGFQMAAGLEFPIGKRKNIHIECKYFSSYNVSEPNLEFNSSGLFLMTGFNL